MDKAGRAVQYHCYCSHCLMPGMFHSACIGIHVDRHIPHVDIHVPHVGHDIISSLCLCQPEQVGEVPHLIGAHSAIAAAQQSSETLVSIQLGFY
jgi:hypothetical protein